MNVTDTISSVISLAHTTVETLNRLRRANENNEDVKTKLDSLVRRSSELQWSLRSINEKLALEGSNIPEDFCMIAKKQGEIVMKKVEEMNSALNSVTMGASPGSSSNPLRRVLKRAQTSLKATLSTKSIAERLDTVGLKLEEAISDTSTITRFMIIDKLPSKTKKMAISGESGGSSSKAEVSSLKAEVSSLKAKVSSLKADVFRKHFDTPEVPQHVVFDYMTRDQNEQPVTAEGRLMRTVITLSRGGEACGVSAVGSHGMGGVGKTTALRGLCHVDEVKEAYQDGIWFLEFGEDANDDKVSEMIQRCVENSGGDSVAKEMAKAGSLSKAIFLASAWMRWKKILLVCDDLWPIKPEDLGYVRLIKKLLVEARGSVLLVSTRFPKIAESVGNPTSFEPLEAGGEKARAILRKAASDSFSTNDGTNAYMDRLLDICGGLPLTLSIAGAGVKNELKRHKTPTSAIKHYCERLQRFIEQSGDAELPGYPCLSHVIEASLNHCDQWRQGVRKFFESLCVLQKQATIPIRCLSGMWGVRPEEAFDIAEKFEEASLVRLEPCGEEPGLRLHDLVLKLCQGMVQADERRSWHARLCHSYLPGLGEVGAWWDVEDDGYIMGNLSRHLIESGRVCELDGLVCDVRWLWRRKHTGGWVAWEMDFERLIEAMDSKKRSGLERLHWTVKQCWL